MTTTTAPRTARGTRPRARPGGPIGLKLVALSAVLASTQYDMAVTAAEFADSPEWVLDGASSAAVWLAQVADVEACTAREWIRVGRAIRTLPVIAGDFESGVLSYSKVRTLTRDATPENEAELAALARPVPAPELGRIIAAWFARTSTPEQLDARHRRCRSVHWRTDPDGMVTFTLRLPPHVAATLMTVLATLLMRTRPVREPDGTWPSVAQRHADGIAAIVDDGTGTIDTEVILHVRGDGATCDDGTPISDTVIEEIASDAFIRALIHDAKANPSTRQAANATPPPARNAASKNATKHASTAADETSSNTTTTRPTKTPATPTSTNSNSAAPPATKHATTRHDHAIAILTQPAQIRSASSFLTVIREAAGFAAGGGADIFAISECARRHRLAIDTQGRSQGP